MTVPWRHHREVSRISVYSLPALGSFLEVLGFNYFTSTGSYSTVRVYSLGDSTVTTEASMTSSDATIRYNVPPLLYRRIRRSLRHVET